MFSPDFLRFPVRRPFDDNKHMACRLTAGLFLLGLCGWPGLAQTPAPRPEGHAFEVATVKLTPEDFQGRWMRMQTAHQFVARGYQTRVLIAAAYNLPPRAVSGGPAWLDSDRYDVHAETPGDVRPGTEEQLAMVRRLIADRFQLKFHREDKEFSVYAFSIAKGGAKLKVSDPVTAPEGPPLLAFVMSPDMIHLPGHAVSMAELCAVFQRAALDKPVIDRTGLTGRYDFDLEFAPDESLFGGVFQAPDNPSKPGLFAALQEQLGLRLDATRGTISAIVIDHIDRPSDN